MCSSRYGVVLYARDVVYFQLMCLLAQKSQHLFLQLTGQGSRTGHATSPGNDIAYNSTLCIACTYDSMLTSAASGP